MHDVCLSVSMFFVYIYYGTDQCIGAVSQKGLCKRLQGRLNDALRLYYIALRLARPESVHRIKSTIGSLAGGARMKLSLIPLYILFDSCIELHDVAS